ncbi:hypothetical protein CLAFUW4_07339 [Fulvia fulva]|uniref:Uncharacterized protein n=1 Tax=Passalora fulva TaxID=5499 RepID=A0A9Q8UQ81_PASFU|nr:uncharacterized protein CLAFUR5_07468 [Fulvia fulva]KAK4621563.1 hypothetical protein CLAFUR4_07346 [Fulvia fulva]KAK4622962.1 hypothetical protein CLAFUR0_07344 [Fulvia fulva]UJO18597.1 hypothetical protein CLAFUR5_07468 [Fulvia fulva]WPV16081.1 hypothetical protein CLAFUW4_07339 [Fulvia fulva]WPV30707.1 hypothetical protein CLAFUW7_07340 [Fulvia fulva]
MSTLIQRPIEPNYPIPDTGPSQPPPVYDPTLSSFGPDPLGPWGPLPGPTPGPQPDGPDFGPLPPVYT